MNEQRQNLNHLIGAVALVIFICSGCSSKLVSGSICEEQNCESSPAPEAPTVNGDQQTSTPLQYHTVRPLAEKATGKIRAVRQFLPSPKGQLNAWEIDIKIGHDNFSAGNLIRLSPTGELIERTHGTIARCLGISAFTTRATKNHVSDPRKCQAIFGGME